MSDDTDKEQRDAEKEAGKEIDKAKEGLKKLHPHNKDTNEQKKAKEAQKKKIKKKLNAIKQHINDADYQTADDEIDEIIEMLDDYDKDSAADLKKALEALEKIKDKDLWKTKPAKPAG